MKLVLISALGIFAAASAFAFESTVQVILSPVYTVAATVDTTVFGPTASTVSLSGDDVAAVKGAQADALGVAQGAEPTDAFDNGKAALEKAAHVKFPSNEKAALAILDIDSQLSN